MTKEREARGKTRAARRRRKGGKPRPAVRKVRVGVVFGGKSGEHEISLLSAQSVMRAIGKDRYDIVPIGITTEGGWLSSGDPLKALSGGQLSLPEPLQAPEARRSAAQVNRALIPGAVEAPVAPRRRRGAGGGT